MNGRRIDAATHTVLAIDADKRVLDELPAVATPELPSRIQGMFARFGDSIRILVDGATVDPKALARFQAEASRASTSPPVQILEPTQEAQAPGVELAHAMLWDTYDRAARVQSWMLEQASAFTLELLNNNKRLADQAGELQKRYQTALAEIDYMAREQKLMESEAAASHLSRHLIEKARAEIEAANPTQRADWFDDLIDGAAVALGAMCGARGPRGPKDSN
jgi:hypothetical protein